MPDRSRWFESFAARNLWRRVTGNDALGILRSNTSLPLDLAAARFGTTDKPEATVAELPLRPGRTFPPDMPRPGAEYGATGTPIFGGFITGEDYNPKLDGAKALLIYDEMRRGDAQVNSTMRVLKLPLLSASWDIDPPDGSTDPQDKAIADFCASALFDDDAMAQPWGFALRHILLKLDFGVSLLEKIFTVGELGEIRYHRLAPRLPRTIFRWIIDPETGALEAVVQFAPKGGAFQYLTLPAMYTAVFCHEREGDNYFGRSVLRSAYQHWWRKQQLYNLDSVRLDRYGVGIPKATIAENHRPTDAELGEIKKILRYMRSQDKAYLIEPFGVTFSIMTPAAAGGRGGAAGLMDAVNHHNFMISANILAGFLNDPSASKGAKAHTQTLADIFEDSLQAVGDETAGDILTQLVRPLCDLNFDMTGRKYPVVRVSGIDSVDTDSLSAALQKIGPSMGNARGFVTPDDGLEDWIRDQLNAPPRDPVDPSAAPTGQGGVEAPNPTGTTASPGTPGASISSQPARATPAVSSPDASRASSGAPSTETTAGQIQQPKSAVPNPRGDSGGSVTATPLEAPAKNPPMTEATSVPRPARPIAAGQPPVGPTSINLDPTTEQINVPGVTPHDGLGKTGQPQGAMPVETAYGFGGPRKVPATTTVTPPWPHGPLGPITPPPPPGGASGAPPLGFDNRLGNNDGFPLGLKADPVVIGGRTFCRQPTTTEQQILNFREIPDRLDQEKQALMGRLTALRKQQATQIIADLVQRDASPATGSFTDLRPDKTALPLANDVYLAIRAAQGRVAKYGALQVRSELQKQGAPVTAHGGRVNLADTPPIATVFFVRHGETADDVAPEKISSQSDVPLNAAGRQTAEDLAHLFADVSPLTIVCSPQARAQETAAAMANGRTDVTLRTDPEWSPWHLGDLTGETTAAAQPAITRLESHPDEAPPHGESWHAFTDRINDARQKILRQASTHGATIVLTHSWILKMTAQELAGTRGAGDPVQDGNLKPGSVLAIALANGHIVRWQTIPDVTPTTPPIHLADRAHAAGSGKQTQISALVSSAQVSAKKLNDGWFNTILDTVNRLRRNGTQGADLEDQVRNSVMDAIDSGVAREAGQEVNEAFGLGRQTEAAANSDLYSSVVRSAIMDSDTCDQCATMDGTAWDADDPDIVDTPDPDCDGRDSCRCVNLYMTDTASDEAA